jgi:hypothetical protein
MWFHFSTKTVNEIQLIQSVHVATSKPNHETVARTLNLVVGSN